jgi:hypothetical protein
MVVRIRATKPSHFTEVASIDQHQNHSHEQIHTNALAIVAFEPADASRIGQFCTNDD